MKSNFAPWKGFVRRFRRSSLTAALLLSGSISTICQAAPFDSPAGVWDFLSSGGGQPGIAYLTFAKTNALGGDFSGYALIAGMPPLASVSVTNNGDLRGAYYGRDGTELTSTNVANVGTNSVVTNSFVFGFVPMGGPWEFDGQGRVIGAFSEILNPTSWSTNYYAANVPEIITNASDPSQVTNILVVFTDGQAIASTNYLWATNSQPYTFQNPTATYFAWTENEIITNSSDPSQVTNIQVTFTDGQASASTNYLWATHSGESYIFDNPNVVYFNTNDVIETITNASDPSQVTNIAVTFTNGQPSASTDYLWLTIEPYTFPNPNFKLTAATGETTNAVSFVGTVVPGKRFNLVSSSSDGKVTYKGVPAEALPNQDGSAWYGVKFQNGQRFVEFFSLHSFAGGNPFMTDYPGINNYPNIYWTTDGVGPSYDFYGIAVISKQKEAGFAFQEFTGSNAVLRATVGSFTSTKKSTKAVTQGVIEPDTRIRFNATKQPSP
jgi:hypothetical protein